MKKALFLLYVLIIFFYTNPVFAQDLAKTLELRNIDCTLAKGKILGSNIKLEIKVDGTNYFESSKRLKSGTSWPVYQSYDYIDFVSIRILKAGTFKSDIIDEISFDKNTPYGSQKVNLTSKEAELTFNINVTPGPSYEEIIIKQLRYIANIAENIKQAQEHLESRVSSLETENSSLQSRINSLIYSISRCDDKVK